MYPYKVINSKIVIRKGDLSLLLWYCGSDDPIITVVAVTLLLLY